MNCIFKYVCIYVCMFACLLISVYRHSMNPKCSPSNKGGGGEYYKTGTVQSNVFHIKLSNVTLMYSR
jgi:hypothetical protein